MLSKIKNYIKWLLGKKEPVAACGCNGDCQCKKQELPSYTVINVEPLPEVIPEVTPAPVFEEPELLIVEPVPMNIPVIVEAPKEKKKPFSTKEAAKNKAAKKSPVKRRRTNG